MGLVVVDDWLDAIMLVSWVFWRLDDDDVGSVDTDVGEVWSMALARGRDGVDMLLSLLWTNKLIEWLESRG